MADLCAYTAEDKLACARRELEQRRRVYGRLVDRGRMSARKAQWEIGCMESIAADYQDEVAKSDLFHVPAETGEGRADG